MEPIEEYLRNLHKKNSPHTQSREHTEANEERVDENRTSTGQEAQDVRTDVASAPTTELPTVVAALRNNEPQNTRQQSGRTHTTPTRATRRNKRTHRRPRRYDMMIIASGVAVVAVIVGVAFIPRGSERTVAHNAPAHTSSSAEESNAPYTATSKPDNQPSQDESAHDAVIRLCNERALAFSTTDEELLRSLTVDGSPARKAERFADVHKYEGADIAIDATDIDVVKETPDSAVVTATVTAHPETGVRLTLTLKKVDKRWRVWEVTE